MDNVILHKCWSAAVRTTPSYVCTHMYMHMKVNLPLTNPKT